MKLHQIVLLSKLPPRLVFCIWHFTLFLGMQSWNCMITCFYKVEFSIWLGNMLPKHSLFHLCLSAFLYTNRNIYWNWFWNTLESMPNDRLKIGRLVPKIWFSAIRRNQNSFKNAFKDSSKRSKIKCLSNFCNFTLFDRERESRTVLSVT